MLNPVPEWVDHYKHVVFATEVARKSLSHTAYVTCSYMFVAFKFVDLLADVLCSL